MHIQLTRHLNRVEQRLSVLVPYMLPICSLPCSHAVFDKRKSWSDIAGLQFKEPDLQSTLHPRAPPLIYLLPFTKGENTRGVLLVLSASGGKEPVPMYIGRRTQEGLHIPQ